MPPNPFEAHNAEVQQVWEAYRAGHPVRTPLLYSANSRIWVQNPELNQTGLTWREFLNDPQVMLAAQLKFRYYLAHHIPQDAEMGLPAKSWPVFVEFQNIVEQAWFGSPVSYPEGQVAVSQPIYTGAQKWAVFERDRAGPFDGIYQQMRQYYEFFVERAQTTEYCGRPLEVLPPGALGTDGPFTIAMGIRGAEILEDILIDEIYFHRLMNLITEAVIQRVHAWRAYLGQEDKPMRGFFADDAIQFLSAKLYIDRVLPYHRRLLEALYGAGPHAIHLCGNVQRHLPTIVKELNVNSIDTGFPIRWETLRDEVGEQVEILGGVPVGVLLNGSPQQVHEHARAILQSGIRRGGKFIFKEANNLPPGVPAANLDAMYQAVKMWGVYAG